MTEKKQKNVTEKHNNKGFNKLALIIVLILIIIIITKLTGKVKITKYNDIQVILDNTNITSELTDDIILKNNKVYMSFDDIKNNLDETIYKEEETNLIITSSDLKVATLSLENKETITTNGAIQEVKDAVIEENQKTYINISDLEGVYNYKLEFIEGTNIVTIDNLSKKCVKATLKKKAKIKQENKMFSKSIEELSKGDEVIYISEENGVAKIRTKNGNIGYIKTKLLENITNEREDFENINTKEGKTALEYDITEKDITTFKKREEVINLILQEAIKNDKMYVKIIYNGEDTFYFERFKIEATSILKECGITTEI